MVSIVINYNFEKHKLKPTTNMSKQLTGLKKQIAQVKENAADQLDTAKLYHKQCCRELALSTAQNLQHTEVNNADDLLADADKIYNWLMVDL